MLELKPNSTRGSRIVAYSGANADENLTRITIRYKFSGFLPSSIASLQGMQRDGCLSSIFHALN